MAARPDGPRRGRAGCASDRQNRVEDAPLSDIEIGPLVATEEGTPDPRRHHRGPVPGLRHLHRADNPSLDFTAEIEFGQSQFAGRGQPVFVPADLVALGDGSFKVVTADDFTYPEEGNYLITVHVPTTSTATTST